MVKDGLIDLNDQIKNFKSFFYFHGYQPPRKLIVEGELIFDISGENELVGGYNERVWRRCYFPMTNPLQQWGVENPSPIMDHQLVSGHLYGTTRDWIKKFHNRNYQAFIRATGSKPIPIVDSYLHVILPLMPDKIQELLIEIGIRAWEQDYGKRLINIRGEITTGFGFWPAELGINTNTARILASKGVRVLILNIDQLETSEYAPVYEVDTGEGKILVLAYNGKEFAQKLAFSDVINSQGFADKIREFIKKHNFPPLAAMDMETFGEWRGITSLWFLNYFVHKSLSAEEMIRNPTMVKPAKIRDATSWSCVHELGRWTGKNSCDCDNADNKLRERKRHLYEGLWGQLDKTLKSLESQTNWQELFVNFFVNHKEKVGVGDNISFENLRPQYREPFKRLLVNLVGFTSCGWFYSGELERRIPEKSLEYLKHF